MKTVDKIGWRRLSADPWRLRCPEGHTRLTLNAGRPEERSAGWRPKQTAWKYSSTHDDYAGQVNCKTCGRSYHYAIDVKDDEKVVLEPDIPFVTEQADY